VRANRAHDQGGAQSVLGAHAQSICLAQEAFSIGTGVDHATPTVEKEYRRLRRLQRSQSRARGGRCVPEARLDQHRTLQMGHEGLGELQLRVGERA
jgi:hypothetical protein